MKKTKSLLPRDLIKTAVEQAREKKAEEILILDLSPVTSFTDYFVIMTVQSDKQAQSVMEAIVARLKEEKIRPLHREGEATGRWILLDYVDFVIHIFQPDHRSYYALERLWGDAPDVTETLLT